MLTSHCTPFISGMELTTELTIISFFWPYCGGNVYWGGEIIIWAYELLQSYAALQQEDRRACAASNAAMVCTGASQA